MTLTFVGRADNRWQVRVDVPCERAISGLTLALYGEEGRPLGPLVVQPVSGGGTFTVDLRGPCSLPPGTVVRCVADIEGGGAIEETLPVDRRRGLHAFMHADARLPLSSRVRGEGFSNGERRRLQGAFPWLAACEAAEAPPPVAETEPDLVSLLRDEFGVDVGDEELRELLKG